MKDFVFLSWVYGVDRKMSHEGHWSASRFAEWYQTVILNDGFFYPHHTPMIDTFSCVPFDLPDLIFKLELAIK